MSYMQKERPKRRTAGALFVALAGFGMALVGWMAVAVAASSDEIVDRMIAAHGGMEKWATAPTVYFEDEFRPGTATEGLVSHVTVEQGRRRAYIDYPPQSMSLTWDGEKCWSVDWSLPTPPRFLAQLSYYFVCLPWLTKDPGVVLGKPGTKKLFADPTEYIAIHMGFEPGVGDTPKDYYELYIHPETHRLHGFEYIVTYKDALPEGMEQSPPHVLLLDEWDTVDGLLVPTHYTIYDLENDIYATCSFTNWSFTKAFDASRMTMPEAAVVDTSQP